jgi:polysaccharide deacetylase family protein (PEP-CTERM system associated)
MLNALTFDIEDYYQVEAFKDVVKLEEWSHYPSRVVENTGKIVDVLDEYKIKATFFVLGWVAERFPNLVVQLAEGGHEIATHGYAHQMVYKQTEAEFEQDLVKSINILEKLSGQKIRGYRAPTYSIIEQSFWAYDVLIRHELSYDSSIFPIVHDRYGVPNGERFPHRVERGNGQAILEFPLSTLRIGKWNFPIAGGGYLRLLPYLFLKAGLRWINSQQHPAILYLHPWELDPDQPRFRNIPLLTKFRHYVNLHSTESKLRKLLRDFQFAPIREVLQIGS